MTRATPPTYSNLRSDVADFSQFNPRGVEYLLVEYLIGSVGRINEKADGDHVCPEEGGEGQRGSKVREGDDPRLGATLVSLPYPQQILLLYDGESIEKTPGEDDGIEVIAGSEAGHLDSLEPPGEEIDRG